MEGKKGSKSQRNNEGKKEESKNRKRDKKEREKRGKKKERKKKKKEVAFTFLIPFQRISKVRNSSLTPKSARYRVANQGGDRKEGKWDNSGGDTVSWVSKSPRFWEAKWDYSGGDRV